MKRILPALALALSAIAAHSASINLAKPTVALKIPQTGFTCGAFSTKSYYCFGLPVITVRNGVSTTGYLWTDDYAASFGHTGFVYLYSVPVANAVINSRRSTPDGAIQEDISGPNYTGKFSPLLHNEALLRLWRAGRRLPHHLDSTASELHQD